MPLLGRLLRQPRLWAWLFWLCLASVTALALLPDPDGELPSVNWDKGNHLIAFGTLAFLARLAYPGQPAGWLFLALCAWGVSLIAQTGLTFDLVTPHGKIIASVMASLAEFERDLIRERIKSGLEAARARAKRHVCRRD